MPSRWADLTWCTASIQHGILAGLTHGHAVRTHWSIENNLHWVLDVAFGEDASRIHKDHAPQNMAVMRHMALNLLQRDQTHTGSMRTKRLCAGWNDGYLETLLTALGNDVNQA